jgi:hypothetical protein
MKSLQRVIAVVGLLFGIATIVAGVRVFLGSDPGYAVYRPLLAYNTLMGLAYVVAGALAWVNLRRGQYAAAMIFVLNCFMLAFVGYVYAENKGVAVESLRAMTFRTVVWLVLFVGLAWLARRKVGNEQRDV